MYIYSDQNYLRIMKKKLVFLNISCDLLFGTGLRSGLETRRV